MRTALGLLILYNHLLGSLTNDLDNYICRLTLVASSVRQPYSGVRCVKPSPYPVVARITYKVGDFFFTALTGMVASAILQRYQNHRNQSLYYDRVVICPTLKTITSLAICECCPGYRQDNFNSCIPTGQSTRTTQDGSFWKGENLPFGFTTLVTRKPLPKASTQDGYWWKGENLPFGLTTQDTWTPAPNVPTSSPLNNDVGSSSSFIWTHLFVSLPWLFPLPIFIYLVVIYGRHLRDKLQNRTVPKKDDSIENVANEGFTYEEIRKASEEVKMECQSGDCRHGNTYSSEPGSCGWRNDGALSDKNDVNFFEGFVNECVIYEEIGSSSEVVATKSDDDQVKMEDRRRSNVYSLEPTSCDRSVKLSEKSVVLDV